jgi:hypothetical protein
LTYTNWQSRTDHETADANTASDDAGGATDDLTTLERCKQANVDGWSSLKITHGPDGICVDVDRGSFPDAVVQSGGCDPPPGGILRVSKAVNSTAPSGSYRADSELELSLTWPGTASGAWTTVVSGSGRCTYAASVAAVRQK